MLNGINSERCVANPIFMEEVYLYLKERIEKLSNNNDKKFYSSPTKKVMDYCVKFCYLKKEKVKIIRNYINETKDNSILNDEEIVQAEIILCKIIDLNVNSFKTIVTLLPGYKRYFKLHQFRQHYNKLYSIMNGL